MFHSSIQLFISVISCLPLRHIAVGAPSHYRSPSSSLLSINNTMNEMARTRTSIVHSNSNRRHCIRLLMSAVYLRLIAIGIALSIYLVIATSSYCRSIHKMNEVVARMRTSAHDTPIPIVGPWIQWYRAVQCWRQYRETTCGCAWVYYGGMMYLCCAPDLEKMNLLIIFCRNTVGTLPTW